MKFAFDVHGVIDSHPEAFSVIIDSLLQCGHEVHILTGRAYKPAERELKNMGIKYTTLFSITDYHESIGTSVEYEDEDNPWIDDELWDRTKADYCREHNIDICFDDTERYAQHFSTPFFLIKSLWVETEQATSDREKEMR